MQRSANFPSGDLQVVTSWPCKETAMQKLPDNATTNPGGFTDGEFMASAL
jgi:hypothetical protein